MITGAWDRFWAACVLWLAIIGMLEFVRLLRVNRLPWWVIHGPVLAWGAVALLPWFIALRTGFWLVPPVSPDTIPLGLPATYGFSLLNDRARGLRRARRPHRSASRSGNGPFALGSRLSQVGRWSRFCLSFAVYVISLPSWSNLWTVDSPLGEDLYSGTTGSFLSLSLIVLAGVAIGYLASQQVLSKVGIALYLALLVMTLGSAHRYLILILILAYLILRRPSRAAGSPTHGLVLLILSAAAVWLIGFSGLGQLSLLRSGVSASSSSVNTQKTLSSFDVMSSAEYLLNRVPQPAQLHGSLLPRFPR